MQRSLFLLVLMGQCSFLICHLYEYHFIDKKKTWGEAQKYCREKYTDLATVSNMTDMERLSAESNDEAWIGLYNQTDPKLTWHWSLPGVEYNETEKNWGNNEPDNRETPENCVRINSDHSWADVKCEQEHHFICYDETGKNVTVVNKKLNWTQAQSYCRENHTDLISGRDQLNSFKSTNKSCDNCWIGLYKDTWRWSDGSSFSFRHWSLDQPPSATDSNKNCATLVKEGSGRWGRGDCSRQKPFFCYDDKVILIKDNKTWEEALYYCREHHNDLVTITNLDEQRWVQEKAKNASTPFVWLGLHYTCVLDFWFWVSNNRVTYENWASEETMDDCAMSAAMDTGGQHKWFKTSDYTEFNFICSEV